MATSDAIQILSTDALSGLRSVPSESVQVGLTSPPFYLLRRYGTSIRWPDGWEGELGHEPHPNDFVRHLLHVFDEVRRVLREDGCLWVNLIQNRSRLHDLPGFHAPPSSEKSKRVDLALLWNRRRTLVSAKWRIRADREEQFHSDFEAYARLKSAGRDFDYTLVTNEFDAARLKAACERRRQNALLFTHVVHINPEAVLAAYGGASTESAVAVRAHVESGRRVSLQAWLDWLDGTMPAGG